MNGSKNVIKEFLEKVRNKNIKKDQILIFLLVGVLLLIIALPSGGTTGEERIFSNDEPEENEYQEEAYTRELENRLEKTLSQMDGAGQVAVMITLKTSSEQVVEKDTEEKKESITESDSQGGSRTTQNTNYKEVAVYGGDEGAKSQTPYISKRLSPRVEGVVVIAPGGDDPVVVKNITEAVQALFGIDTHKIRIVKGRREGK
ncbi:stage III sporulation protein AG [Lachnospiraceae bacterium 42-17]